MTCGITANHASSNLILETLRGFTGNFPVKEYARDLRNTDRGVSKWIDVGAIRRIVRLFEEVVACLGHIVEQR